MRFSQGGKSGLLDFGILWIRWIPDTNIPLTVVGVLIQILTVFVCLFVSGQGTTFNLSQSKINSLGYPRSSTPVLWRYP
jgi:hypothetical protein